MGIEHTTFMFQALPVELQQQRLVEGPWIQKCPSGDCIRLDPLSSLQWDIPTAAEVRHTSKSWLAAVTRTVEWRIGAMCVSQWLTCFQKSQVLMPQETVEIWRITVKYLNTYSTCYRL